MRNWASLGVKPADMSIAFLWTNFAGLVLPAETPDLQREEMRKAFFAGFLECFHVVNDYATTLPEKDAVAVLSRLNDEGRAFFEKLIAEVKARKTTP